MTRENDMPILNGIELPKYIWSYELFYWTNIATTKKPNFIHRFFCRLLLWWKWIDLPLKNKEND
jgi:hypothetical protein